MASAALIPLETNINNTRDIIVLQGPKFTLGRAISNSFVLKDLSISRYHSIFEYNENGWTIRNTSTNNKTFINDNQIEDNTTYTLSNNDMIKLTCVVGYKFVSPYEGSGELNFSCKRRRVEKTITDTESCNNNSENSEKLNNSSRETRTSELNKLKLELNRQKYLLGELKKENNTLRQDLQNTELDIMIKSENCIKLEQENTELKSHCVNLEKEKSEMQLELMDFECQTTLLKLRLENIAQIRERTENNTQVNETVNIISDDDNNSVDDNGAEPADTQVLTDKELEQQMLQSVLKTELIEKERLLRSKVTETLDLVKTIRSVKTLKNVKQRLENVVEQIEKILLVINELSDKQNELVDSMRQLTIDNNKSRVLAVAGGSTSNVCTVPQPNLNDSFTQSKEEFIEVLKNQKDAIAEMKEVYKAEFVLKFSESMELDLQCVICHEWFIRATCIDCGHVYCRCCIMTWLRQRKTCPTCRKPITKQFNCLALDSYINQVVDLLFSDKKEARLKLHEAHEMKISAFANEPVHHNNNNHADEQVVDISSEDDSLSSYSLTDESDSMDSNSEHEFPNFRPFRLGTCFICGDRRHWANTCPHRRRR